MSTTSGSPTASRDTTPAQSPNNTNDGAVSASMTDQIVQEAPLPEILRISKSRGADVLSTYHQENSEGMYFSDSEEAFATIRHAQWQPPANDTTIPQDDEQDKVVVRRLVTAFLDLESAMDTEGNAYRKRFTPGTTVFYSPWTIERCAWEILHMVKTMHLEGFKAPIFDFDILKCIGQTEQWTFEERISMICRVVKISKSVAVSLMKHEKVWTTIGAPHKLYNSTLVNTQSNAYRNKWVKAGREADKANGEQPAMKRKRGATTSNTSRKSSATIVPSPLVNTFPSQPSHQASSSHPGQNGSDGGIQHPHTSVPHADTFAAQTTRPAVPPTRPSTTAGSAYRHAPFNLAPIATQMPLPQSPSHYTNTTPTSNNISAIDALRSSMGTPMATTFASRSASPYAVPAPVANKINNTKLRATSAPTFGPPASQVPVPTRATTTAQAPPAQPIPTNTATPGDNDIEMADAAPSPHMEAKQNESESNPSIGSHKILDESQTMSERTAVFVGSQRATRQVADRVPADTVTTHASTTTPASNPRSAAEFDAAELLLGLRKTEG